MKKFIKVILLPLLIGLAIGVASAQTTTVSGTVVDSDSVAWAKGFITFRLTGSEGSTFYCSGTQMTSDQITVSALLDAAGSFSTSLCSNNNITPTNSQWAITINSAATSPPQNIAPTIISGTTQDLSSYINSRIAAIRIPASTIKISAYIDGEIVFPVGGSTYYNLSSTFIRLYNGAAWNNLATGTVSVTSVFGRTGAVTAQTGDYTAAQVTNALDVTNTAGYTLLGNLTLTTGKSLNTPIIRDGTGTSAATLAAGRWTIATASALSLPTVIYTGAPITGGTGTTNWPYLLFQPVGTTTTTWGTNGTYIGINAPAAYTGNFIDLQFNGASQFSVTRGGTTFAGSFHTGNCASSASPAVCAGNTSGSVAVPAGTNPTLTVNMSNLSGVSEILLTPDQSLGTKLSVTCNTTAPTATVVTSRVASTSFTFQAIGTFTTNPVCYNYLIMN